MKKVYTDVAVIGAGSAGLVAFRTAKKWTSNVVLIEGGPYGTTCARVGCMPSKLLIAAAEAAHAVEQANDFGIRVGEVSIDGVAVIATGSTPTHPPILNGLGDRLVVNDDIFNWTDLPKYVAVFGPGVIGIELGQALGRLGVEVLIFGRGGPLGPLTDPKVSASASESLGREFFLDTDANVCHRRHWPLAECCGADT